MFRNLPKTIATTRIAIATPSSTSCASLYSEDLACQSETKEELLGSDWFASAEIELPCSMIYSQNRENNTALFIKDSSRVGSAQALRLSDRASFEQKKMLYRLILMIKLVDFNDEAIGLSRTCS